MKEYIFDIPELIIGLVIFILMTGSVFVVINHAVEPSVLNACSCEPPFGEKVGP